MKKMLVITAILLLSLTLVSAQESNGENIEEINSFNGLSIEEVAELLSWEVAETKFELIHSLTQSQTSSWKYSNSSDTLLVDLIEKNTIYVTAEEGNSFKIIAGSYDDDTGEITYEYNEIRGNYKISMKYTTTKPYKGIEEIMKEISGLLNLQNEIIISPNMYIEY